MTTEHVKHSDLLRFAEERVNLKQEDASILRNQANNLRDKLESYVVEHPQFALKKMMLSGSLAKGTALKSTSDIDMALYVGADDVPSINELAGWIVEKLREAYPQMSPDQIKPQRYSICVSFKGTGLDIDIVPILYDDDPDWRGNLVSQLDGSLLMTSIPLHLDFIRSRKSKTDRHYAQLIRLLKYWAKRTKLENNNFRCKSFLIEMIVAHLYDAGKLSLNDYPTALKQYFDALAAGLLKDRIIFTDYYEETMVPENSDLVQVIDPVNPDNNVTSDYTQDNLNALEEEALAAGDAIDAALYAPTKQETVEYWRQVFGNSFSV